MEEFILREFGARLREARLAIGMTQQEVADVVGASQSYISRLEHGRENPLLTTCARLAEAVEKDLPDLLPRKQESESVKNSS